MEKKKKLMPYYKKEFKKVFKDIKTKGKRQRQIPNILTMSRFLAPLCIIPAAILGNILLAVIFAVMFSLTDVADGIVARKMGITSEFGSDLDAATDKVFSITLLGLAATIAPIVIITLIMEVSIAAVNYHAKKLNYAPASSFLGRMKTWSLYPLIISTLMLPMVDVSRLILILFGATTFLQGCTVSRYISEYRNKKKDQKEESNYQTLLVESDNELSDAKQKEYSKITELKEMKEVLISATEQKLPPKENAKIKQKNKIN